MALASRYKKVKEAYPVSETRWETDRVFEAVVR
jgi:hypothetical protein